MGMRPSIGSSGMGISSGNSGSSRSTSVSVNQGGVTVGINIGVAEIGVTTDYGGAGKIGFGGQSVTWGLEGGKIQMGIAGFELIVEARNCVITEIKKIAGQVVSTRTYPDPGCKQPSDQQKPQLPQVPPEIPDEGSGLEEFENSNQLALVSMNYTILAYSFGSGSASFLGKSTFTKSRVSTQPEILNSFSPFFSETTSSVFISSAGVRSGEKILTTTYLVTTLLPAFVPLLSQESPGVYYVPGLAEPISIASYKGIVNRFNTQHNDGIVLYGTLGKIHKYVKTFNQYHQNRLTRTRAEGMPYNAGNLKAAYIYPIGLSVPLPPGGNRPPMNSSCCKAILADLEDLKEVLAVKEMLKGECTFPWRLRMPGGQGEEKITDYANYLRALAQEIDHLGIHPPNLYIQDNNNAQEGDQTVDIKFPSATSAFEALMKQVWDDNSDGDTRTNFLYRLAWLSVQNQEMCLRTIAIVKAIAHGLGIETEVDTVKIPIPFNVTAGIKKNVTRGQGFGKGSNPKPQIDNRIDLNTEIATEALLPEFLQCRENEVLIETFSGDKEIMSILSLILMHVEKLNSK